MPNIEPRNKPLLNAVLRGSLFALGIQSVVTVVLLAAQHSGRGQIAPLGIACFVATSVGGFAMIARHLSGIRTVVVGIVYFPTMFGLMFFEAVILDARLYGNTF